MNERQYDFEQEAIEAAYLAEQAKYQDEKGVIRYPDEETECRIEGSLHQYFKYMMDGAKDIHEVNERLHKLIEYFGNLQERGFELQEPVFDSHILLVMKGGE